MDTRPIVRVIGKIIFERANYHVGEKVISVGGLESQPNFDRVYVVGHEIGHGIFYTYIITDEKLLREFLKIGGWGIRVGLRLMKPEDFSYEQLKRFILYGSEDKGYFNVWVPDYDYRDSEC